MKKINFYGNLALNTGIGNSTRSMALACSQATASMKVFSKVDALNKSFILSLNPSEENGDIDFYCSPPMWNVSGNNYKIAYFGWDTDQLPRQWVSHLGGVNEIWTPTLNQKNIVIASGFKGDVSVIPTPCISRDFDKNLTFSTRKDKILFSEEYFKFYSIADWNGRKGIKSVLEAYYKTFKHDEKVCLILKTRPVDGSSIQSIMKDINQIKYNSRLKYFPKVFLITDELHESYVSALHSSCHVFVSPHHGEVWGMSLHDAMMAGNLIISTKYGGISDWISEDTSKIIKHVLGPVTDMSWNNLYNSSQTWANPSVVSISSHMRDVYQNYMNYEEIAVAGQELAKNFDVSSVSQYIKSKLEAL